VASRDPADELRAQIEHSAAGFGAALRPLAEAYLRAMDQASAELAAFARAVGEALTAPRGRAELPAFTCPRCGRTSHHPADLAHGYCGACHDFTGRPGG
jgi:hypothetical protein